MSVYTGLSIMAIDAVFRALSDPTRRHVLEQLSKRPASVSELAAAHNMALPSFVQHLGILEQSGLVRSTKAGRVRTYQIAPQRLKFAEDWLARQRKVWERRLDQFDDYVMELHRNRT